MDLGVELADINKQLANHRESDKMLLYMRRHLWRQIVDQNPGHGYRVIRDINKTSIDEEISDSRIQQELQKARKEKP